MTTDRRTVRLLINGLHAKAGGGVSYLRNMLPELSKDERLDITLLLHDDQRALFEEAAAGMRTVTAGFRSSFLTRLLWEQIVLPWRTRALGADVTFSPANFCPLFVPRPVILLRNTIEAADTETRLSMRIYWKVLAWMTRASLWRCRRAIAVSDYAGEILAGPGHPKVTVVHHGVDERFSPAPDRALRESHILAVGTIYQQKNLHTLIRAFAGLRDRFPDATLRLIGGVVQGGEDILAALKDLVRDLTVEDRVEFAGPRAPSELVEHYRRCAVFVLPSTAETFGQPLVEAMACGAPVVCSNAAAMPEVAGDAALVVDPRDATAMAEAIGSVLADPKLAESLSQKSLARAAQFSWGGTARRTADILVAAAEA